jgi:hydroxymethylglutaryl-CoA lyase
MIFTLDEDLDIGSWMLTRLGSVGNFPTEDLVAMLAEMGMVTGIDPEQVVVASHEIARMLGIDPQSYRGNDATRKSLMSLASSNPNMRYS